MTQAADSPCSPYTTGGAIRAQGQGTNIPDTVDADAWCRVASNLLYRLTGRRFPNVCVATIRPAHQGCSCGGSCAAHAYGWPLAGGFGGYLGNGAVALAAEFSAPPMLLCASTIDLGMDCQSVQSIKIDGVEIDTATWRLDPGGRLIRQPDPVTGQPLSWPCCQRRDLPSGSVGTFEVSYSYGDPAPTDLVEATKILATEYALSAAPMTAGQSRLPERAQTLTRQGVTAALISDLTVLIERGYTGIPAVDRVIGSLNPNHLQRRARIISPDDEPHHIISLG